MKRINRYAVLRIPTNINYEDSVNRRKRIKKRELYRRRYIKNKENIKNKKLSVICYVIDEKLIISCPLCHNTIDSSNIGSKRYSKCKICGCIYDKESNEAMKYYYRYLPNVYYLIESRRQNNKYDRQRLKMKHQKEQEDRFLKKIYPLITVINENGKEDIVTLTTKRIKECKDLNHDEKEILIWLQIPVDRYKMLKKLGVNFTISKSESVNVVNEKCNN